MQALIEASGGRQSVGALLTLAAIGRGVLRGTGSRPLTPLFASAEGLVTALRRLLPILQVKAVASPGCMMQSGCSGVLLLLSAGGLCMMCTSSPDAVQKGLHGCPVLAECSFDEACWRGTGCSV